MADADDAFHAASLLFCQPSFQVASHTLRPIYYRQPPHAITPRISSSPRPPAIDIFLRRQPIFYAGISAYAAVSWHYFRYFQRSRQMPAPMP